MMSESQMESSTSPSAADDLFDQGLVLFQRLSHAAAKERFQAANNAEPDHARSRFMVRCKKGAAQERMCCYWSSKQKDQTVTVLR